MSSILRGDGLKIRFLVSCHSLDLILVGNEICTCQNYFSILRLFFALILELELFFFFFFSVIFGLNCTLLERDNGWLKQVVSVVEGKNSF